MSPIPGTLEVLARELGYALEPLEEILGPELLDSLGLRLPQAFLSRPGVDDAFRQGARIAGALPILLESLVKAIESDNERQMIQAGLQLLEQLQRLIEGFQQIGDYLPLEAEKSGFSVAELAEIKQFFQRFPVRLLNYTLVEYLLRRAGLLTANLILLGLVDYKEIQPDPAISLAAPHYKKEIHLERILALVTAPEQYFQSLYGWGTNDFDGKVFFSRLKTLLEQIDFPSDIFSLGSKSVLEAYLFSLQVDNGLTPPGLELLLRVPGSVEVDQTIDLTPLWTSITRLTGTFGAGVTGTVSPPVSLALSPPSGILDLELLMGLKAQSASGPMIFIGSSGGSRLESGSVEGSLGITARWDDTLGKATANPSIQLAIQQGKLVIDLSQGDSFLQEILANLKVEAGFDIKGNWDLVNGLQLIGSSAIEVFLPVHIDLGLAEIKGVYVIGIIDDEVPFQLDLETELQANLGPLQAVIERMGVTTSIDFPKNGNGNLGLLDIGFQFRPPRGIGLSLDISAVKGGGYLFLNQKKGEYVGAIELVFSEFLTLKAIGIITTKMPDGSPGFSLLIAISVEFGAGIQIGFGFTLVAVGGLLGLNRSMRLKALADRVRTGAANRILFPKDVVKNISRIISDLNAIFPVEQDKFLIGPMAKLGWGTPPILSLSLGLIIEIPGNLVILGVLRIVLPADISIPEAPPPLVIFQVSFIGAVDFAKKQIFFFATLFESRVLHMTLSGEMGVLTDFGDKPTFLISIGGFHPQFTPPPMPFAVPKRITLDILNEQNAKIRVMGYFAVTSNTVQFGARADLKINIVVADITGHLAFDALIQFSPFYFIVDISASLTISCFLGEIGARVKLYLEGPTNWRAKGRGEITILWFEIAADFDISWGETRNTTLPKIDAMPILKAELQKLENWQAQLPTSTNRLLVSLRKLEKKEGLVLHPIGSLQVNQKAIPLDLTIDKVGNQKVRDGKRFELKVKGNTLTKVKDTWESFAPAQFQEMDDTRKLSRPGYEPQHGGLDISIADDKEPQLRTGPAVKRSVGYEEITIDTEYRRQKERRDAEAAARTSSFMFSHFQSGGSIAQSALSHRTLRQAQPFEDKISIQREAYSVVFASNNQALNQTATFESEAMARDYMNRWSANPENQSAIRRNGGIQVIPKCEAVV